MYLSHKEKEKYAKHPQVTPEVRQSLPVTFWKSPTRDQQQRIEDSMF